MFAIRFYGAHTTRDIECDQLQLAAADDDDDTNERTSIDFRPSRV